MAIFKDKTGRGEVDYTKPVQADDGTILFLDVPVNTKVLGSMVFMNQEGSPFRNDMNLGNFRKQYSTHGEAGHLVFQLRGHADGVTDISRNKWPIQEISGTLTKRMENVTHNQRLRTYEFSDNRLLVLTASVTDQIDPASGNSFGNPVTILPHGKEAYTATYQPYTIFSGWIYVEDYVGGSDGGGSCIIESRESEKRGFGLILTETGELCWRFYDWAHTTAYDATKFQQLTTQKKLEKKKWYHFCIIAYGWAQLSTTSRNYNSNGLDEKHQNHGDRVPSGPQVAIFINGEEQKDVTEANVVATAVAAGTLTSTSNFPLVIGGGLGGLESGPARFQTGAYFKGRLAELTWFKMTNVNTQRRQISELGYGFPYPDWRRTIARSLYTGKKQPASGINNNSERLLIRDIDNRNTHPTINRSGDSRRLGNSSVSFDDSSVPTLFGTNVHFPTKLIQSDALIRDIYSGYHGGFRPPESDMMVQTTASLDSMKNFYRPSEQNQYIPFDETRFYIDSGSIFYQTGTLESVVPGFDKPLHNKEMILIDLSPVSKTEFGYTGSLEAAYNSPASYGGYNFNHVSCPVPHGVPSGSLMMYWNNTSRVFEKKGHLSSYKAIRLRDVTTHDRLPLVSTDLGHFLCSGFDTTTGAQMLLSSSNGGDATAAGGIYEVVGGDSTGLEASGRPISTFKFPFGEKYEQDSTDTIKMSNYISEPFVLEKIVYEYSGSFECASNSAGASHSGWGISIGGVNPVNGPSYTNTDSTSLQHYTFFLLRQFKTRHNPTIDVVGYHNVINTYKQNGGGIYTSDPSDLGIDFEDDTSLGPYFSSPTDGDIRKNVYSVCREIIGYGQHFLAFDRNSNYFDSTTYNHVKNNGAGREVNSHIITANSLTGSFRMEFSPSTNTEYNISVPFEIPIADTATTSGVDHTFAFHRYFGGRGNSFETSTRSLARNMIGQREGDGFITLKHATSTNPVVKIPVKKSEKVQTPYILMPGDELIMGWQAPMNLLDGFSGAGSSRNVMSICPGGKLVFYGSFLRDSQPRPGQLNQLLDNHNIHESIGAESICDQWEIEPSAVYSGSLSEEVISGSTEGPLYGGFDAVTNTDRVHLARRVGGRRYDGTLGTTGSLKRNTVLSDFNFIESDSYLFDLQGIFAFDERTPSTVRSHPGSGSYINDDPTFQQVALNGSFVSDMLMITDDPEISNYNAEDPGNTVGTKGNLYIGPSFRFARYPQDQVRRVRQQFIGNKNGSFAMFFTGSDENFPGLIQMTSGSSHFAPQTQWWLGSNDSEMIVLDPAVLTADYNRYFSTVSSTAKFFFGFGDGVQGAHIFASGSANMYYPSFGYAIPNVASLLTYSGSLRGFRYGHSNITDKYPKAVFRRSHYGQFRDMLESPPNTAYVDQKTDTTEYPVSARFFNLDGSSTSAENTNCSNLSQYCTSSAPFFDRDSQSDNSSNVIRNRTPLNNAVADITIEI